MIYTLIPLCLLITSVGLFLAKNQQKLPLNGLDIFSYSLVFLLSIITAFSWSHTQSMTLFVFNLGESHFSISIMLDMLSVVMLIIVTFISLNIIVYSSRYLLADSHQHRFQAQLSFLIFSVIMLIISGNLLTAFISWQFIGISLYLLLNHYHYDVAANRAAKKKFMLNRIGDIAFLFAILLCYKYYHTSSFQVLFSQNEVFHPSILWLIVLAIMTKSAQFPFHIWLIDTMEAPSPVSALMHAGVVNSGGFLLARLSPLYIQHHEILFALFLIGLLTALLGQFLLRYQYDVKKRLAYSTMAQMGFMILQCGMGSFISAVFHLIAHGLFKSTLFLNAGNTLNHTNIKQPVQKSSLLTSIILALLFILSGIAFTQFVLLEKPSNAITWLFIFLSLTSLIYQFQANSFKVKLVGITLLYIIFGIFLLISDKFTLLLHSSVIEINNHYLFPQFILVTSLLIILCLYKLMLKRNVAASQMTHAIAYYKLSIETLLRTFFLNTIRLIGQGIHHNIGKNQSHLAKALVSLIIIISLALLLALGVFYHDFSQVFKHLCAIAGILLLIACVLYTNRAETLRQLLLSIVMITIAMTILLLGYSSTMVSSIAYYYFINQALLLLAFVIILTYRRRHFLNDALKVHTTHNQLPLCHFYFSVFLLMMIGIPGTSSFVAELILFQQINHAYIATAFVFGFIMWMMALSVLHALQIHFFNPKAINLYAVRLPVSIHLFSILVIVFNLSCGVYPEMLLNQLAKLIGVQ